MLTPVRLAGFRWRLYSGNFLSIAPPQGFTGAFFHLGDNLLCCRAFWVHPGARTGVEHTRQPPPALGTVCTLLWVPLDDDFAVAVFLFHGKGSVRFWEN